MSARTAKRWGRRFVFAWLIMWVSTALLPCCEVEAAIAAHEQAAYSDCEHSGDSTPDANSGNKHTPCLSTAAPVPASDNRLVAAGANPATPAPLVSTPSYVIPSVPALSLTIAYRAAPPPVAVYLRSLRLLI